MVIVCIIVNVIIGFRCMTEAVECKRVGRLDIAWRIMLWYAAWVVAFTFLTASIAVVVFGAGGNGSEVVNG